MNAIITGSNGFTGRCLGAFLRSRQLCETIIGIGQEDGSASSAVDEYFPVTAFDAFASRLQALSGEVRVFHLAGLLGSHPLPDLVEANVAWTARYLDAAKHARNVASFICVGSSAIYGRQTTLCMHEGLAPAPVTPYGVSKLLQEQLALLMGASDGLHVIATRTFNLIGPGLSESFLPGRIVGEFQRVVRGQQNEVHLGRMDAVRDFIDVRDAVEMYWMLSTPHTPPGIYNVGTGIRHSVQDVYEICTNVFGITPAFQSRPVQPIGQDVDAQWADLRKTRSTIPKDTLITLDMSIRDMKAGGFLG